MLEVENCENRLKSMIIMDKQDTPKKINKLLKSEILFVLKNYFDITAEDLNIDIDVNEFGKFNIKINAEARSMEVAHLLS